MSRRAIVAGATALAVGGLISAGALATAHTGKSGASKVPERSYQITVENLTTGQSPVLGQPLSPPLIVAHNRRVDLWSRGRVASHVVAGIAEDANNGPAIELANALRGAGPALTGVDDGATDPAPILPGASQTYSVKVRGHRGRLTLLSMLVNTNDAFTGLDSVRLPRRIGASRSAYRVAYDAGSEKNNEDAAYIPGPVGGNAFVRDPEGNVIRRHPGIAGGASLDPVAHSVSGKVAKITITRVR
jgi:hypothetical protein